MFQVISICFLYLHHFFFLFNIIYNRKAYFLNYNLQTNEKKKEIVYHPIYPSLRLLKTNPFCLFPRLKPTPLLSPDSKTESHKMSKSFGLQDIFNLLSFGLVYSMLFFIVERNFFLYVSNFLELRIFFLMIQISQNCKYIF